MNKWTKAARARLVEIQGNREGAEDMRVIAAALSQPPRGQLNQILHKDVMKVLEKYGVGGT